MRVPGIGRLSFGARIVVVLVAILLLMQAATLLIVDVAVNRDVHRQLAERIDVGDKVWRQLQRDRGQELTLAVGALASDFAFREALATGDASTVLSALHNHGQRMGADASLLLAVDGSMQTSTLDGDEAAQAVALAPLLEAARDLGARSFFAFRRIFIPGIRRGVVSAILMVFIPSVGSYVIPDLVGGTSSELIGNKIYQRTFPDRNLPHASALSALMAIGVLVPLGLVAAFLRRLDRREALRLAEAGGIKQRGGAA